MRRAGAHVTQAYFLPLWNILELDSYMIRLAAKGWIRRSPIGAGALSSKRGRCRVCIVPIDESQCPHPVRRKTPCAEGRPRSASHLGKTLRGTTPHEPRAVTKPRDPPRERRPAPGNVFLTHAQSKRRQSGLYRSRVHLASARQAPDRCWETGTVLVALCELSVPSRRRGPLQFES